MLLTLCFIQGNYSSPPACPGVGATLKAAKKRKDIMIVKDSPANKKLDASSKKRPTFPKGMPRLYFATAECNGTFKGF
jgi:hypothetical protein